MAIMRLGKTARDKARGVWDNRFKNRQLRVEWQNQTRGKVMTPFPKLACNGKRNRHRFTGKGGKTVIL